MNLAIQGLGWFVRRAAESGEIVRFYRDRVGLADLRSGERLAMLWAGGVTVFEPNQGGGHSRYGAAPQDAQVLPVFASRDLDKTMLRLGVKSTADDNGLAYLRDPAGNWLALEASQSAPETVTFAHLPEDIVGLTRVIIRSTDPQRQAAHMARAVGKAPNASQALNIGAGVTLCFAYGAVEAKSIEDREEATDALVFRTYDLDGVKAHLADMDVRSIGDVAMPGGDIRYYQDAFGLVFGLQQRRDPTQGVPTSWLPEDIHARALWEAEV